MKKKIIFGLLITILLAGAIYFFLFWRTFGMAKKYIANCSVAEIWQSGSSKNVKIKLKSGREILVRQPEKDAAFQEVFKAAPKCGTVLQVNEK